MAEWLTYSPADFLMFAPRTYYRLLELYNRELWPAQFPALAIGLAILGLLARDAGARARIAAALLASVWAWVAWAFHLERYATINAAAVYFAVGFGIEALLLLGTAFAGGTTAAGSNTGFPERAGLGLIAFALLLQPLVGLSAGRSWFALEYFGLAPDPAASATLGAVLALGGRVRWELLVLPLAWCLVAGATAAAMESPEAPLMPALGAIALGLAIAKARSQRS